MCVFLPLSTTSMLVINYFSGYIRTYTDGSMEAWKDDLIIRKVCKCTILDEK